MAVRAVRPAAITEVFRVLWAALATTSTYLLAFPLTFIGTCLGSVFVVLGMRGVTRAGIAAWGPAV